jgi:hypothetical protein
VGSDLNFLCGICVPNFISIRWPPGNDLGGLAWNRPYMNCTLTSNTIGISRRGPRHSYRTSAAAHLLLRSFWCCRRWLTGLSSWLSSVTLVCWAPWPPLVCLKNSRCLVDSRASGGSDPSLRPHGALRRCLRLPPLPYTNVAANSHFHDPIRIVWQNFSDSFSIQRPFTWPTSPATLIIWLLIESARPSEMLLITWYLTYRCWTIIGPCYCRWWAATAAVHMSREA